MKIEHVDVIFMVDGCAYMSVLVPLLNCGGSETGFGRGTREWNIHLAALPFVFFAIQ